MKDDNCIFCKLANGDIPTMSLYEDDDFNVIFDAGPATAGHALILPKEHFQNIFDAGPATAGHALILPKEHFQNIFEIDEEVQAKAYKLAKKMAPVLTEVFEADGLNVLQNNNEAAGQTVFHYHIHLIPRYKDDKSMVAWTPGEQDKEKLEKALEEIRKRLA